MAAGPTQLPTAYCLLPTTPGIRFDERGLVPVVVQEATSGAVLLLAYMNAEALEATLRTGHAHFWSRSRGRLWRKGERSGREQIVEALYVNCEENSLLLRVHQQGGAACHTGHPTCYYRRLAPDGSWQVVEERVFDPAQVYGRSPSSVHDSV
jgi:phosphoribosyl-AMP cyclohydrolase